jgi:multiple sugar transport system permease protein
MGQKNAWLVHLVLIVLSILFAFPLVWMVSTSLKPITETMHLPVVWIPSHWMWINYPRAFTYGADKLGYIPFLVYGRNTLILAVLTVSGTVLSNALVATSPSPPPWRP